MIEQTSPYEAPHTQESKPARSIGRIAAIGCGGMLLCALLGVGTCALVVKEGIDAGEKEFGPPSDRYFAKVSNGDYHGAYADFGAKVQGVMTEEAYVALDRAIHDRTGKLESKKFQSVQAGIGPQGRWGRIIYSCQFEKGPVTVRIELQEENHAWKVEGFNYDSPSLEESIRELLVQSAVDAGGGR